MNDREETAPQAFAPRAFAPPPGLTWHGVSPQVRAQWRVTALLWLGPVVVVGVLPVWWTTGALGAGLWLVAALLSYGLVRIVAELAHRSLGYAERSTDFLLVQGILTRRLTVIPYNRLTAAYITASPLQRRQDLATLHLRTATHETRIPGLPASTAATLRSRLNPAPPAASHHPPPQQPFTPPSKTSPPPHQSSAPPREPQGSAGRGGR